MYLYLKHLVATSDRLSQAAYAVRRFTAARDAHKSRHLGILSIEDDLIDQCLARFVRKDFRCLDIGAHIGSFSQRLRLLAPDGDVVLIEPSVTKARWLSNRFGEQNVIQAAVSDAPGMAKFFDDAERPGFSKLGEVSGVEGETYDVPVIRLDDQFADRQFDFIKIDIEGHEFRALKGGEKMLRRDRPVILYEAGGIPSGQERTDADNLYDWLTEEVGYKVYPAFHLVYHRAPVTAEVYQAYRRYPFACFNFFALPVEMEPTGF